ncbi:MAG: hypothetical protein LBG81_01270 [Coriobacteriaceae bacterium]|nr:hypothetical protein [Coriobacteriaceae bacterium]
MIVKCTGCGASTSLEPEMPRECPYCGSPLDVPLELIRLESEERARKEDAQRRQEQEAKWIAEEKEMNKRWYHRTAGIVLLLFLFFPVGLYLMWKYATWPKAVKVIITMGFVVAVVNQSIATGTQGNSQDATTSIEKPPQKSLQTMPGVRAASW